MTPKSASGGSFELRVVNGCHVECLTVGAPMCDLTSHQSVVACGLGLRSRGGCWCTRDWFIMSDLCNVWTTINSADLCQLSHRVGRGVCFFSNLQDGCWAGACVRMWLGRWDRLSGCTMVWPSRSFCRTGQGGRGGGGASGKKERRIMRWRGWSIDSVDVNNLSIDPVNKSAKRSYLGISGRPTPQMWMKKSDLVNVERTHRKWKIFPSGKKTPKVCVNSRRWFKYILPSCDRHILSCVDF